MHFLLKNILSRFVTMFYIQFKYSILYNNKLFLTNYNYLFLFLPATIVSQEAAHFSNNPYSEPIDLTPTVIKPDFTKRWNNFDFELLHKVGNDVSGNFMISPASVKAVLVMLLEGAGGNCAKELRNTLRLPTDYSEIRQQLGNYLSRLRVRQLDFKY